MRQPPAALAERGDIRAPPHPPRSAPMSAATAPSPTVRSAPVKRRRRPTTRGSWLLLLLAVPGIVWFVIFAYGPMAGLVVAFKNFNIRDGIFNSPWNGIDNFTYFLASGDAPRIVLNTLFLNTLFLSASLITGLLLALMLNEIRIRLFKRFMQSTIFFPYFVSPIVISIILQVLLAGVGGRGGTINDALSVFNLPQVTWYTTPGPWPWILTIVKIWQIGGYTSIIFLAAITSIPGRSHRWNVLPRMISPPMSRIDCGVIALTEPYVPTGMNAGVSIVPRGNEMRPRRAAPSLASTPNCSALTARPLAKSASRPHTKKTDSVRSRRAGKHRASARGRRTPIPASAMSIPADGNS